MNVWLLGIGVGCQSHRRRFIISLTTLLLLTLCINNARAAAVTWTNDAGGICRDAGNWFPNQAAVSGDQGIVPNSGACTVTNHFATPPIKDLLCHHRRQTGSRFGGKFHNDLTVARNGCLPLNSARIIVAAEDAAPPFICFNTATARGPPWPGDPSLNLSDTALDCPVPHFCTAPLLSEFPFHASSLLRNLTRRFNQPSLVGRACALIVTAISQSNTTKPFTKRSYDENQM